MILVCNAQTFYILYRIANIIIYHTARSACLGEIKWKLFDNFVFVS
jgi:hypothetical protein